MKNTMHDCHKRRLSKFDSWQILCIILCLVNSMEFCQLVNLWLFYKYVLYVWMTADATYYSKSAY